MVTLMKLGDVPQVKDAVLYGLSTDTKPTHRCVDTAGVSKAIENGSLFYEMDTKKGFLYDAQNHTWLAQ